MTESAENSQRTLNDVFKDEGIKSMTIASLSADCTIQFVRSLASLDHSKSDYWCKVGDAERILKAIEALNPQEKRLTRGVVEACLARRVIHKCLRS